MTDQTPSSDTTGPLAGHPLAERALGRLRALASGNGIEPAAIAPAEIQESLFTLGGVMEISPLCETENTAYPGGIRGKDRKTTGSFAELAQAVAAHQKHFRETPDWVAAATEEIKAHESQGWGLENAKVTLPEKSAVFAATEICPSCQGRRMLTCTQCNGRGTVTCTQCQGQGRELCYNCGGRGENPQQPGQPCHTCNGTRYAPCRFCQSRGFLSCPTCQGQRGTPCAPCQGTGSITQEVAVTCGAETHFKLIAKDLPSGLRRGLERAGIENLGKGYADIKASPPPKDEDDEPHDKPPFPILTYQAVLPYAEIRMNFGRKKAVISVFGKRGAMMGVPPFLDEPLQRWRDKLRAAAAGKAALGDALDARAMRDILALTVAGRGRIEPLRKLYPFGLSEGAMKTMLADMRLALNRATLKTRAVIAAASAALCAALFYLAMMTGFAAHLCAGLPAAAGAGIYMAMLAAGLTASWGALNFSTRLVLKKRFPQLQFAMQQKIGKTGYAMLAGIVAIFILMMMLSPAKPLWLGLLLR
ncbi:MAG: hypothetical protein KGI37_10585 [Alphaproteobacteria bacterium]|nr:hypothetical protein [Alphaproteobacteria bacterium]